MTDATTPHADGGHRAALAGAVGTSVLGAWLRLVIGALCQSTLATLVFLALWAAVPALFGWQPTTVSSGSMMPRLQVGDVAVARPLDGAPALGQVLLFRDPDHPGRLRLHRFVRVDDQGRMVMKGDANASEDSSAVTADAVEGVAFLRVPTVALPVVWMREGRWVSVGATSAALLLLLAGAGLLQDRPTGPSNQGAGGTPTGVGRPPHGTPRRRQRPRRSATRRPRFLRPAVVFVALVTALGITGLVLARPAWARYTVTTTNPGSSLSSASLYRCPSAVLPLAPTLYYRLDEASGSVATDSSGAGAHGTLQSGYSRSPSAVCSVPSRAALTLNGSTGYLSTPTLFTAPNTFTIQVWFKTTTTRGGRLIGFGSARTGSSSSADRHIYLSDTGQIVFGVQTATARPTLVSASGYNDGSWHLVTASLSSAGMRLHVDDNLVGTRATPTSGIAYTGYWRVGYDTVVSGWANRPNSNFFAGTVAEAVVYPTALTNESVASVYNVGRP